MSTREILSIVPAPASCFVLYRMDDKGRRYLHRVPCHFFGTFREANGTVAAGPLEAGEAGFLSPAVDNGSYFGYRVGEWVYSRADGSYRTPGINHDEETEAIERP